jgi:hypothetical protein
MVRGYLVSYRLRRPAGAGASGRAFDAENNVLARECADPTIRDQIEEMAKQWGHRAVATEAHENEVHKPRLV